MINQRNCPFCNEAAGKGCAHLALAIEARDFVGRCIELCQGQLLWQTFCQQRQEQQHLAGQGSPEREDFTWLESAFCDQFLKHLHWFGGIDYEWRTGRRLENGGFWVLLWSKDPRQLWWELREELERRTSMAAFMPPQENAPWLIWLTPR
jgi:hypothetical protein